MQPINTPSDVNSNPIKDVKKLKLISELKVVFKNKFFLAGVFTFLILTIFVGILIFLKENKLKTTSTNTTATTTVIPTETPMIVNTSSQRLFAKVDYSQNNITANVPKIDVKSDLSNVANIKRFDFNTDSLNKLKSNLFVVTDGRENDKFKPTSSKEEFFSIYEQNRYGYVPSFITTDSILHTYHLMFDDTLQTLEQAQFAQNIQDISSKMIALSKNQYNYFKGENNQILADAAQRNEAFFSVAQSLINPQATIPQDVKDIVNQELSLIDKAQVQIASPILNYKNTLSGGDTYNEDYSQYKPRGHYTKTDLLKRYFKSMMWLGRMTFRQLSDTENYSAMLITQALVNDKDSFAKWESIYNTTSFLIGNSDDLGIYEYKAVLEKVFGDISQLANFKDSNKLQNYITEIKKLSPPRVNSMVIYDPSINPDKDRQIKGFRFMGQRYTLDADIFQNLIYREVTANSSGEKRMLPKSLDLIAAMGSDRANQILENQGDTKFGKYKENLNTLKTKIAGLGEDTWSQNIYNGWLYTLKPFATPVKTGYPDFMNNDAWKDKDINTYQGSWTELKHDTILYSKQPYAEKGAGGYGETIIPDTRGYVEPRNDVYSRLEALVDATIKGLDQRNLLKNMNFSYKEKENCTDNDYCTNTIQTYIYSGDTLRSNLNSLKILATKLKTISEKELQNQKLTDDEYSFIENYGGDIEHLWYSTLHNDQARTEESLDKNPSMLVADVATDPNGSVLEEGTGKIMNMFVIIPVPGEINYLRIAQGGVWSHFEFTQPIDNRLTDEQWRSQIRDSKSPSFDQFKNSFISQNSDYGLKPLALSFKNDLQSNPSSLNDIKNFCTQGGGKFNSCDSACPENNLQCSRKCEPTCRFY